MVTVGLLGIAVAAVAGQLMCSTLRRGRGILLSPEVFCVMVAFSCASSAAFTVARRIPSPTARILAGIAGSYLAILAIVFVFAAIKDEIAESLLWLPAMLVFGTPLMAPLVGLSWLGSTLVARAKER